MRTCVRVSMIAMGLALLACGDDGGTTGGAGGAGGGAGTTTSTGGSTTTGSVDCTELTADTLVSITGTAVDSAADYPYGVATSAFGGAPDDQLELDLYDGLDTITVDVATDSKNGKASTCEACGWIFEDGGGLSSPRIYFWESGQLAITLFPGGTAPLAEAPKYVQMTDVTFREVTLTSPGDLYSAKPVVGGACLHVADAHSEQVP